MKKNRILSRNFMHDHPVAGCNTYFVEAFLNSLYVDFKSDDYLQKLFQLNAHNIKRKKIKHKDLVDFQNSLNGLINVQKMHTIRGGNHFRIGEAISMRCWLNKAYHSPQIILWDDLMVCNLWDFERVEEGIQGELNTEEFFINGKKIKNIEALENIANNDGLLLRHFHWWFNKPFTGQIICWSKEINY